PLEDLLGLQQIRDRLGIDWTARDLGEAVDVPKTSVLRRLQKFLKAGVVEKVTGGKRGRTGGLARYRFRGVGECEGPRNRSANLRGEWLLTRKASGLACRPCSPGRSPKRTSVARWSARFEATAPAR